MRQGHTFYMTADEIRVIAAASGMKSILLFQTDDPPDRIRQIQAIFRLIRDGFLLQNNGSLVIGAELAPFVDVFKRTADVILVRPAETEAPPFCIYRDASAQRAVTISPAANRENIYKLCIVDVDMLVEELESLRLLPMPHTDDPDDMTELPDDIRPFFAGDIAEEGCGNNADPADRHIISRFERFSLAETVCTERFMVYRSEAFWAVWIHNEKGDRVFCYCRSRFSDWLKGGEK